jgi:hypothetical protein
MFQLDGMILDDRTEHIIEKVEKKSDYCKRDVIGKRENVFSVDAPNSPPLTLYLDN